jgi:hypothetical protein
MFSLQETSMEHPWLLGRKERAFRCEEIGPEKTALSRFCPFSTKIRVKKEEDGSEAERPFVSSIWWEC